MVSWNEGWGGGWMGRKSDIIEINVYNKEGG
jgi:hypothetical protein